MLTHAADDICASDSPADDSSLEDDAREGNIDVCIHPSKVLMLYLTLQPKNPLKNSFQIEYERISDTSRAMPDKRWQANVIIGLWIPLPANMKRS